MTPKQLESFRKSLIKEHIALRERAMDAKGMEGLIDAGALYAIHVVIKCLDEAMDEDQV